MEPSEQSVREARPPPPIASPTRHSAVLGEPNPPEQHRPCAPRLPFSSTRGKLSLVAYRGGMDSSKQPIARCGRWATPRRFASPTLSLAVATTPGCAPAQRRLLRSLPSEHHRRRQQQRQREPLAPRLAPPPGGVGRQSRLSRSRSSQGTGRGGLTPPLCRVGSGRMPPDPRPAGVIHHSTHAPPAAYLPCYLLGSRSIIVVMTVILVVVQCTIISITYSSGVEYLPAVHLCTLCSSRWIPSRYMQFGIDSIRTRNHTKGILSWVGQGHSRIEFRHV